MNKKIKKILTRIIVIIISTIFGFLSVGYLDSIVSLFDNILLGYITVIAIIFISTYVQTIIHELGHLVFGLLSGYKFVSFRIGSMVLVKIKEKIYLKKFNIPGTAGQCLLVPPEVDKDYNYPFIMYNLGGGIFNILFSIIFLTMYSFVSNILLMSFLPIAGVIGLFLAVINLFPLKAYEIANDGSNLINILKDENAKRGFYLQLKVNYLLTNGVRLKDMDEDYFNVKENADLNNHIINSMLVSKVSYYIDKHDFYSAKECILKLLNSDINILAVHLNELRCELLFLECLEFNSENIEKIYNKDLKKYIDITSKFMLGRQRLLYSYEKLINNNLDKAEDHLKKFNKMINNYPYLADIEMEEELIKYVNTIKI